MGSKDQDRRVAVTTSHQADHARGSRRPPTPSPGRYPSRHDSAFSVRSAAHRHAVPSPSVNPKSGSPGALTTQELGDNRAPIGLIWGRNTPLTAARWRRPARLATPGDVRRSGRSHARCRPARGGSHRPSYGTFARGLPHFHTSAVLHIMRVCHAWRMGFKSRVGVGFTGCCCLAIIGDSSACLPVRPSRPEKARMSGSIFAEITSLPAVQRWV
jgi:hypothetical protein